MCWLMRLSRQLFALALVGLSVQVSSVLSEFECVTATTTEITTTARFVTDILTTTSKGHDITIEVIVHVTPFWNNTVVSRTEYIYHSAWEKRRAATVASVAELKTSGLFNSSRASTTEALKTCTYTYTITETRDVPVTSVTTQIETIPGRTYTVATTLFDYDYISPPVFSSTESTTNEVATIPPVVTLSPAPTTVPSMPKDTAQPSRTHIVPPVHTDTNQSQRKPGQGGQPAATQVPNSRPGSSGQGSNLLTLSLPGIGSALVDPARTAIFLPGAPNALGPGDHTVISGVSVSIDSSGSFVVADGKTVAVPALGSKLTKSPLLVDGTTIPIVQLASMMMPGQATTLNNIKMSLSPDSLTLIVGSEVIPLNPTGFTSSFAMDSAKIPIAQFASQLSLLPSGHGILLPNGQTLRPDQTTTINGFPIWLSPSETEIVLAGSTAPLPKNPSGNLGDYLSTEATRSALATSELPQFSGSARKQVQGGIIWRNLLGFFVGGLMEWL